MKNHTLIVTLSVVWILTTTTFGQPLGAVDALYPASTASSSAKTSQENPAAEESEQTNKKLMMIIAIDEDGLESPASGVLQIRKPREMKNLQWSMV